MQKAKDVNEYIASAPKEVQEKLKQLRKTILDVVPDAEEKISYGMPYYGYKGRLVYFAYAKHHIGVYAIPGNLAGHEEEIKQYRTGKATLQFALDKELPLSLIKKLVAAGVINNEVKYTTKT